jgi:LPXTG-motif cell wall-anchored protein
MAFCLALWPALVGAAPPAPQGKLVFEDDFSNATKSGLEDNLQATDYSRGFHAPGVYHLKDLKDKTTNWELFPKQSYGEFSFQTDLWDNSDDVTAGDVSEGVVFRATDETHFYTVLIDPRTGKYAIQKWSGKGTSSDLKAWTDSPMIKRRNEVNQVRVDGEGSNFTIYLNGEKLDSFSDSTYAKGQIGYIASNVDAVGNHIHFDNPKVWSTEAAATTETPPTLPRTGEGASTSLAPWLALALLLLLLGVGLRLRRVAN